MKLKMLIAAILIAVPLSAQQVGKAVPSGMTHQGSFDLDAQKDIAANYASLSQANIYTGNQTYSGTLQATSAILTATSSLTLGTAGTSVGNIIFKNATSGSITLAPVSGALGSVTLSLPAATDTLVGKATTDTLTNKTLTSPVLTTPSLGVATGTSLAVTGAITSSSASAGIGYATGAGCAVTQITNRSTGVTCTGISGAITTDTTSLAAEAAAAFTVTDTSVAIGDVVVVSQRSGANGGDTNVYVSAVANGSFQITVANNNPAAGGAETGAIVINFAVIKAVSN